MPKLYYQGHASVRLTSDKGVVIYIDPYAGDGYDREADIVLITHQHEDHNRHDLVRKKASTRLITEAEALTNGVFNTFRVRNITIRAVPAFNEAHDPRECVGYLITIDGLKVYYAGDTSETDAMSDMIFMRLDYALLPIDSAHTMDPIAASICAARIGARHSIPIACCPGVLFDENVARSFDVPGRMILRPGQEIDM